MNSDLTNHLIYSLRIGGSYSTLDIANMISRTPQFVTQRGGVINTSGDNYLILLITLKKNSNATQYADSIHGNILCWEAPKNQKYAENRIEDINTQTFIMVRNQPRDNYFYLGRGFPIRKQIFPLGFSSKIQFNLFELNIVNQEDLVIPEIFEEDISSNFITERQRLITTRETQYKYRHDALKLWNNQCAITKIDEPKILIASHIKPWRESNNSEKMDPKNSIILSPNYDKLFDLGYITFNPDNGKIILSDKIDSNNWKKLKIKDDT